MAHALCVIGMHGAIVCSVRDITRGGGVDEMNINRMIVETLEALKADSMPAHPHCLNSQGAETVCTRCGFMPMDSRTGNWDTCNRIR